MRLQYAQLRKRRQGWRVSFLYSIVRLGSRHLIRACLKTLSLSGIVQTAFVERANLTFCRPHQNLTIPIRGPSKHRFRTPVMAANLVHHR